MRWISRNFEFNKRDGFPLRFPVILRNSWQFSWFQLTLFSCFHNFLFPLGTTDLAVAAFDLTATTLSPGEDTEFTLQITVYFI